MGKPYLPQDPFFAKAKQLGYVARSAFKLLEIQERFRIFHKGAAVVDLGCSPGAWLQVACQHIGEPSRGGCVVGVDIKPCPVPNKYCANHVVVTTLADVFSCSPHSLLALLPSRRLTLMGAAESMGTRRRRFEVDEKRMQQRLFSVLLSDLCPSTSGAAVTDVACSLELAWRAIHLATGRISHPSAASQSNLTKDFPSITCSTHGYSDASIEPVSAAHSFNVYNSSSMGHTARAQGDECGISCNGERQLQHALPNPLSRDATETFMNNSPRDAESGASEAEPATGLLQTGGHMVVKVLEGEGLQELVGACRSMFTNVNRLRPKATRSCSREVYIVAKGLRQQR